MQDKNFKFINICYYSY